METTFKTSVKRSLVNVAGYFQLVCCYPKSAVGVGGIFALHRVRPRQYRPFEPNSTLEVTPDFLDQLLGHVRRRGLEIVRLDEAVARLQRRDFRRRFVCFTLDDGYADNHDHAFEVFKRHDASFTIFVTSGLIDQCANFWWLALERILNERDSIELAIGAESIRRSTVTIKEKYKAFQDAQRAIRRLDATGYQTTIDDICRDHKIDPADLCTEHGMTWDMARRLVESGLCGLEAHTVDHRATALGSAAEIAVDFETCCARIETETGYRPRHFAYPYGDPGAADQREFEILEGLDLKSAATTRRGVLQPGHRDSLMALPRLSLNGYYQTHGYVDLLLAGLPI